jgi:hypothetical protein
LGFSSCASEKTCEDDEDDDDEKKNGEDADADADGEKWSCGFPDVKRLDNSIVTMSTHDTSHLIIFISTVWLSGGTNSSGRLPRPQGWDGTIHPYIHSYIHPSIHPYAA